MNTLLTKLTCIPPLLAVFLWTGSAVIAKRSITFFRWITAILLIIPFVRIKACRKQPKEVHIWEKMIVLSDLLVIMFQGLTYLTAKTTSAINMRVIMVTNILLTAFLASVITAERIKLMAIIRGLILFLVLLFLKLESLQIVILQKHFQLGSLIVLLHSVLTFFIVQ
jgi:drug/metabolite transporter (DMT)-like permease